MMIKRQEWDACPAAAGDVTRRLRRVQELRRLLETEQGLFPDTGSTFKHAQEKLAASASAAKSRNSALLQAIADAADAKPRASASELDAQFLALSAAYLSLVERALPVWAAQVTPELLGSRRVLATGTFTQSSRPALLTAAHQANKAALPVPKALQFSMPQPRHHKQHQQQHQQHQHPAAVLIRTVGRADAEESVPQQWHLASQHHFGSPQAASQVLPPDMVSRSQPCDALPAWVLQQPQQPPEAPPVLQQLQTQQLEPQPRQPMPTQPQPQQPCSQLSLSEQDPFLKSLQGITMQLALLQDALQSQQQQQQQCRHMPVSAHGVPDDLSQQPPSPPAAAAATDSPGLSPGKAGHTRAVTAVGAAATATTAAATAASRAKGKAASAESALMGSSRSSRSESNISPVLCPASRVTAVQPDRQCAPTTTGSTCPGPPAAHGAAEGKQQHMGGVILQQEQQRQWEQPQRGSTKANPAACLGAGSAVAGAVHNSEAGAGGTQGSSKQCVPANGSQPDSSSSLMQPTRSEGSSSSSSSSMDLSSRDPGPSQQQPTNPTAQHTSQTVLVGNGPSPAATPATAAERVSAPGSSPAEAEFGKPSAHCPATITAKAAARAAPAGHQAAAVSAEERGPVSELKVVSLDSSGYTRHLQAGQPASQDQRADQQDSELQQQQRQGNVAQQGTTTYVRQMAVAMLQAVDAVVVVKPSAASGVKSTSQPRHTTQQQQGKLPLQAGAADVQAQLSQRPASQAIKASAVNHQQHQQAVSQGRSTALQEPQDSWATASGVPRRISTGEEGRSALASKEADASSASNGAKAAAGHGGAAVSGCSDIPAVCGPTGEGQSDSAAGSAGAPAVSASSSSGCTLADEVISSTKASLGAATAAPAAASSPSPSRRTSTGEGAVKSAAPAAGGIGVSPTASLHLHQQLVFSPLRLGSTLWRPSADAAAEPAASTAAALEAALGPASSCSAAVPGPFTAAEAAIGANDDKAAVAPQGIGALLQQHAAGMGLLADAAALGAVRQQLVFSPLRLSSASLPAAFAAADVASVCDGTRTPSSTAGSVQQGAFVSAQGGNTQQQQLQQQQLQGHVSSSEDARSCTSATAAAAGADAAADDASETSSVQSAQEPSHEQQQGSSVVGTQADGRPAEACPTQLERSSQSPAGPCMQGPVMQQWEQLVFSPLRSGTATGSGAAAAAAAAAAASPTDVPQRHEAVYSPLRFAAAASASASAGRTVGANTPSPSTSVHLSPQRPLWQRQQQQTGSTVPWAVGSLSSPISTSTTTAAGAGGAASGNGQSPSSQLVLLPGRTGTQQQQQQHQQLSISSLAVGLGPRSPPASAAAAGGSSSATSAPFATAASAGSPYGRKQHADGSRATRQTNNTNGASLSDASYRVLGAAVGPLHSNLGYSISSSNSGPGGPASLSAPVHLGLLLSPATRLSLGGASASDEAAWSSGRPSLGTEGDAEHTRLSLGAATGVGPAAAGAAAGRASVGGTGVRTGSEAAGGTRPVVMASWSSLSSNASGGSKVPRLSLPPTLCVPDAPVPGTSGNRGGASSHQNSVGSVEAAAAGRTAANAEEDAHPALQQQVAEGGSVDAGHSLSAAGHKGTVVPGAAKQQGSGTASSLPPPPPELLQLLWQSQSQQQEGKVLQGRLPLTQSHAGQELEQPATAVGVSDAGEAAAAPAEPSSSLQQQRHQQEPPLEQPRQLVELQPKSGCSASTGAVTPAEAVVSGMTPLQSRQGIGSCRVSSAGAVGDRGRLVSRVLNTGILTEFSSDDEGGGEQDGVPLGRTGSASTGSEFSAFGD